MFTIRWQLNGVVIMFLSLLITTSHAIEFKDCDSVFGYLLGQKSRDSFARVQALEKATDIVQKEVAKPTRACEDFIVERTYFEYGKELYEFSASRTDFQARKTWALKAVSAFKRYLEWTGTLSEDSKKSLALLRVGRSNAKLDAVVVEKITRQWQQERVGGVLNLLGETYIALDRREELIENYKQFAATRAEILSNVVITKWYKNLLAAPEFKVDRKEAEIRELIRENSSLSGLWSIFIEALKTFLLQNNEFKSEWTQTIERISSWLPEKR